MPRLLILWVLALLAPLGCRARSETSPGKAKGSQTVPGKTTEAAEPTKKAPLRLLTYNVLASPVFPRLRLRALNRVLAESKADVIALQEVADWMVSPLTEAAWVKNGYRVTRRDGEPFAPGGQLILSRHAIADTAAMTLPGKQRRTLLVAEVVIDGWTLAVGTTHMESFLEDGPVRAKQLDTAFALLRRNENAVLMGDLNFGDGEQPETSHLDAGYLDLWKALRPQDEGFTWDIDGNPLAQFGAFAGEPSRRLDRILVRSPQLRPSSIVVVGDGSVGERVLSHRDRKLIEPPERSKPDAGEPTIAVFPSDHYGLLATLERAP
jgi:endonuclease/exonuclease/phosphatase family metal-dependent hydrolase